MVWQTSDSHRVRISPRSAARSYVSQQAPHLAPCIAHVCFQRRSLWHAAMQNIFCRLPAFHARRRTWRQPRAAHWCVCRCSHTLLHCAIPSPPHAHSSDSTCCLQPFCKLQEVTQSILRVLQWIPPTIVLTSSVASCLTVCPHLYLPLHAPTTFSQSVAVICSFVTHVVSQTIFRRT